MRAEQKFAQHSERLPALRQLNQACIRATGNSWVGRAQRKHTYVKMRGIKPAHDLARISHLRVGQIRIREAIHQNGNRLQLI